MADTILTESEASLAVEDLGWRYLLARSITKAVRTAGYQTVAHPAHHSVQSLAIAIDAMDIPAVRPFWKAVLGYDDVIAPADLVDPSAGGPSLWFQQMDEPRTQRNRIHLDLTVPHDEVTDAS